MSDERLEVDVGAAHSEQGVVESAGLVTELASVRERAAAARLPYAGGVPAELAWALVKAGAAVLVDVRSGEERKFVGHVPGSLHVAWATGTSLTRNPRFVKEVEAKVKDKNATVLFLCRSGKRSAAAAEAATKAGYKSVFNVLEGFEGEIDEHQHRGGLGGWRLHGLPWVQD
ncbi:MAG: rhodanese-like domain-containing protein [Nevskia sp.]|nr:rhodanese-like domain-containing protein [Nevskia sp.]